ncbi:hypothetical protein H5410_023477 [Solanum commersonii]|uniref:Uncharacterized protein n=1 Tax=Solanum commersonii TaxID=4109 RepID=A0A9J5ZJM7_SOLCO|nr:hypothetical protein H5410_023477 [Solanum commersonii]
MLTSQGEREEGRDLDQVKCIKDKDDKILVEEALIIRRRGIDIELGDLEHTEKSRDFGNSWCIKVEEVKSVIHMMHRGRETGTNEIPMELWKLDEIPVKFWKNAGRTGMDWLTRLFNVAYKMMKMPEEWNTRTRVTIQNCNNYRDIKLLSNYESLEEGSGEEGEKGDVYFRKLVRIHAGTFNDKRHSSCEEVSGAKKPMTKFLERLYGVVNLPVAYTSEIKDIYDGVKTQVRTVGGDLEHFPGVTVLIDKTCGGVNPKLEVWRKTLESKRFRVLASQDLSLLEDENCGNRDVVVDVGRDQGQDVGSETEMIHTYKEEMCGCLLRRCERLGLSETDLHPKVGVRSVYTLFSPDPVMGLHWRSQVRNPLPAKARGLPSRSSSSYQACLVRVTSPMWFESYCIGAGVLPCAHPKGSGCGEEGWKILCEVMLSLLIVRRDKERL